MPQDPAVLANARLLHLQEAIPPPRVSPVTTARRTRHRQLFRTFEGGRMGGHGKLNSG